MQLFLCGISIIVSGVANVAGHVRMFLKRRVDERFMQQQSIAPLFTSPSVAEAAIVEIYKYQPTFQKFHKRCQMQGHITLCQGSRRLLQPLGAHQHNPGLPLVVGQYDMPANPGQRRLMILLLDPRRVLGQLGCMRCLPDQRCNGCLMCCAVGS